VYGIGQVLRWVVYAAVLLGVLTWLLRSRCPGTVGLVIVRTGAITLAVLLLASMLAFMGWPYLLSACAAALVWLPRKRKRPAPG